MRMNMVSTAAARAPQPVIAGARLVLRPLHAQDAAQLASFVADRRVAEGTRSIPHPLPQGAADAFIVRALSDTRDEDVWAMDGSLAGAPALLGVISLKPLDRGQSQIGYWVAPGFWNTGLASEAVQQMVAANPHASRTLFAEVFQDNPGSARVLTKAGFEFIGDAEAWCVARNRAVPTWTYLRRMR
ncbi:MAG: GNAT family N-acetyltransferase [Pararhodobacter sp.]|nr:GNAT family N-acetyltransferase [Pararhodobacter sp.]